MDVRKRMLLLRMAEKVESNKAYADRLGVKVSAAPEKNSSKRKILIA